MADARRSLGEGGQPDCGSQIADFEMAGTNGQSEIPNPKSEMDLASGSLKSE